MSKATERMAEEIDRLARLCEAKDKYIAQLEAVSCTEQELADECERLLFENFRIEKQLSEAQAMIAMQAEALEELKHRVDSSGLTIVGILNTMLAELRASKGE